MGNCHRAFSVRHGVSQNIDGQRVGLDRKSLKELFVISLSLPAVSNIGIVGRDGNQTARFVAESSKIDFRNIRNPTIRLLVDPRWIKGLTTTSIELQGGICGHSFNG